MSICKGGVREGPCRCERCGRFFRMEDRFNHDRRRFCKCPDCVKERSRGYKRKYSAKLYHSSAMMAGKLNQRTIASRRKCKARLEEEAAEAARAKAEQEELSQKAAAEAERALRKRQEMEDRRELQVLGLQAMLFGVRESEEMERVSAMTLEAGMKWMPSLFKRGSLSTFAFSGSCELNERGKEAGRAPPGASKTASSHKSP